MRYSLAFFPSAAKAERKISSGISSGVSSL
jgi:hypothetical protein